jgi:hypothetical protein
MPLHSQHIPTHTCTANSTSQSQIEELQLLLGRYTTYEPVAWPQGGFSDELLSPTTPREPLPTYEYIASDIGDGVKY